MLAAQNVARRLDRIMLDEARLEGIAQALEAIIALDDPVGQSMAQWQVERSGYYPHAYRSALSG